MNQLLPGVDVSTEGCTLVVQPANRRQGVPPLDPVIESTTRYIPDGGYRNPIRFERWVALPEVPNGEFPRRLKVSVQRCAGSRKDYLRVVARAETVEPTFTVWASGDYLKYVSQVQPSRITKTAYFAEFYKITDELVRELAAEAVAFYQARKVVAA